MRKFGAILLSAAMVMSLVACGGSGKTETTAAAGAAEETTAEAAEETEETEAEVAKSADDIPDTMTSEDGTYELAFVTDVGQLKDKSFNQGTYDACCRYGYGFVQGANAAAKELDETVEMKYSWQYGASFSASPELQAMAAGWYEAGTEVIFACGGSMFDSIAAAASANDGYVIGVDSDQSGESDTVITSALKQVGNAAYWAISKAYDGTWDEINGEACSNLGAADGATGLPTATWSMENYSVEEYEEQFAAVVAGDIEIDTDFTKCTDDNFDNVNLSII